MQIGDAFFRKQRIGTLFTQHLDAGGNCPPAEQRHQRLIRRVCRPQQTKIAAVVIGGTLLTGGQGSTVGTFIGVLIQGLIQSYINFDGTLSSWWTKIATGILLFLFIGLQQGMLKLATRSRARHAGVAKP